MLGELRTARHRGNAVRADCGVVVDGVGRRAVALTDGACPPVGFRRPSPFAQPTPEPFPGRAGGGGSGGGYMGSSFSAPPSSAMVIGGAAFGTGGSGRFEPPELDENGYPLPDPSLRSAAPGVSEAVVDCQRLDGTKEARWARSDFPWGGRLAELNQAVFGNRKFRPNQIQVINATVSGKDVFVMMPTGARPFPGPSIPSPPSFPKHAACDGGACRAPAGNGTCCLCRHVYADYVIYIHMRTRIICTPI